MWLESLERDPTLLDYFNTFLSSEAFTIHLHYDITLRDFTIVDDGVLPLMVEVGCQQKFLSWVERERFQPFLRSRLYLQYKLCTQLMDEFRMMVATETFPHVAHHGNRRRSRTTPTPITLLRPQPPPVQRGRLPSIDIVATCDSDVTSEEHSSGRHLFLDPAIRKMDIVDMLGEVSRMDRFIHFLQPTKGRDLVDLWMDVQELNTLQGSGAEEGTPPTSEEDHPDPDGGTLWMPVMAHTDYLRLKYSHLVSEEGKDKRTLAEAQQRAAHKLQTYWLPRYLLQVHWSTQHQGTPEPELWSRCLPPSSPWQQSDHCHGDVCECIQSMDPFTTGLWAESAVGRPLLKYLNQNGMHGLARMLLFWQAVEELRLVEYRHAEATVRDRLAWTLYKAFLHEEGSHLLPVMERDKSAILSKLHDSHMTTRSDAFHELQKLCLSSLKRAWSSYLRANYDYFLRQVTRTPSPIPPIDTPTPTPDMPQPSATTKEGSKKKKKKKRKNKQIQRAVSTLDDDMPGSIHSLVKGKTRSNFGSQSRLSRVSRTSRGKPSLQLSDLDPLAPNIEACKGPLTPKLEAFRLYLEGMSTGQDNVNSAVKNFDFCIEVEKFKLMVTAAADVLILQSKVEAIVDSYLDLAHPPWLLVAIPSHIVQKVVETASQHMQGYIVCPSISMIYRELEHLEWAKQVLLSQLTAAWSEFLGKWSERSRREEEEDREQKAPSEDPVSVDTALSLTCRLPSIPTVGATADKMKITYSLTTGPFWSKLTKSQSAKLLSIATAPPSATAFS